MRKQQRTTPERAIDHIMTAALAVQSKRIEEALQRDLAPAYALIVSLEKLITATDYESAVLRGDELKHRFNEDYAGQYAEWLAELHIYADRLQMDISSLSHRVTARMNGIKRLLNDGDDGQALREAAREEPEPTDILALWRDSWKFAGRTPGSVKDSTVIIGARGAELFTEGNDYAQVAQMLIAEFENSTDERERAAAEEIKGKAYEKRKNFVRNKIRAWKDQNRGGN